MSPHRLNICAVFFASLAVLEAVFHYVKRVLDLGARHGLEELQLIRQFSFWRIWQVTNGLPVSS